jgi:hypothetical protein
MAYFPNGSAGAVLEAQCADCPLGNGPCPVAGIQMLYNYDQLNDGQENLKDAMSLLVNEKGVCEVRKQILENVTRVSEQDENS